VHHFGCGNRDGYGGHVMSLTDESWDSMSVEEQNEILFPQSGEIIPDNWDGYLK